MNIFNPFSSGAENTGSDDSADDTPPIKLRSRENRIDLSHLGAHTKVPNDMEAEFIPGQAYRLSRKVHLQELTEYTENENAEKTLDVEPAASGKESVAAHGAEEFPDISEVPEEQFAVEHVPLSAEPISDNLHLEYVSAPEPKEVTPEPDEITRMQTFEESSNSEAATEIDAESVSEEHVSQQEEVAEPQRLSRHEENVVRETISLKRNVVRKTVHTALEKLEDDVPAAAGISKNTTKKSRTEKARQPIRLDLGKYAKTVGNTVVQIGLLPVTLVKGFFGIIGKGLKNVGRGADQIFGGFSEVLKFGGTCATIFLLTMGVMNYPAYSQIIQNKMFPERTEEMAANLEEVTQEKPTFVANRTPLLPVAGIERHQSDQLPSMDISVIPLDNRLIIPKIGKNVPIVEGVGINSLLGENWNQLEEDIQDGLQNGVVHYPGTAEPGNNGNFFITGHSSYYFWDPGKYKDVFALLGNLEVGDTYTVYYDQKKYDYKIVERKVVPPKDTSVLDQPVDKEISTLMTCWPIGTAKDRLILQAERIY